MFELSTKPTLLQRLRRSKKRERLLLGLASFPTSFYFFYRVWEMPVLFWAGLLSLVLGIYLLRSWRVINKRLTAAEAMARDQRAPILYLRPFKADKVRFLTGAWKARLGFLFAVWATPAIFRSFLSNYFSMPSHISNSRTRGEDLLTELLESCGPVIAIGRPKELHPPSGAARLYVGDEWKDTVHDLLNRSQMVLMFAGDTPHFEWELKKVFSNEPFVPVILALPFFRKYQQKKVDDFGEMLYEASGHRLSEDLRHVRAAYFPKRDQCVEVWDAITEAEGNLNYFNPFAGAIAHIIDMRLPNWSNPYAVEANESKVWLGRLIKIGLVFFGFMVVLRVVIALISE